MNIFNGCLQYGGQQFLQLDEQRKGALFQDARTVNSFLKSGQPNQALNVLSNRMNIIEYTFKLILVVAKSITQ